MGKLIDDLKKLASSGGRDHLVLEVASMAISNAGEESIGKLLERFLDASSSHGLAVAFGKSKEEIEAAHQETLRKTKETFASLNADETGACQAAIIGMFHTWLSSRKQAAQLQKLHDHLSSALEEAVKTFNPNAPAAAEQASSQEPQAQQARTGFADSVSA